jgi:hypothetical protein
MIIWPTTQTEIPNRHQFPMAEISSLPEETLADHFPRKDDNLNSIENLPELVLRSEVMASTVTLDSHRVTSD